MMYNDWDDDDWEEIHCLHCRETAFDDRDYFMTDDGAICLDCFPEFVANTVIEATENFTTGDFQAMLVNTASVEFLDWEDIVHMINLYKEVQKQ